MPTFYFPASNRLVRWLTGATLVALLALAVGTSTTSRAQQLASNQDAARLGLVRSWFAQVQVDGSRNKVVHWVLDAGHLFGLTDAGTVQAFHSETGETAWVSEINVNGTAAGMAVNSNYVAVLGSGRLFVLDRGDGHLLWSRPVGGAPSAAPALSQNFAHVALMNGRIEGYRLDDPLADVWQYQSAGRVFQSPTTTGKVVSWPTDRGLLYVGQADPPGVLFRVETNNEIVTAPAEQAPFLYVASLDGYLYCFHEETGREQWRYATGFAITSQPAIVGEKAFVASEGATLHAVQASTGEPLWQVAGATQFVAVGKTHAYCLDRVGSLLKVDNESGTIVGRLPGDPTITGLINDETDRIFLVNDYGLVQCLHEVAAVEPTRYRQADSPQGSGSRSEGSGSKGEGSDSRGSDSRGSGTKPEGSDSREPEPPSDNPFEGGSPFGGDSDASEEPADDSDEGNDGGNFFDEENPFN